MNTEPLALAYQNLLLSVEAYYAVASEADAARSEADWIITHIGVSEQLITNAVQSSQKGAVAVVDNRMAQDPVFIQSVICESTTAESIERLRQGGQALILQLNQLGQALWASNVQLLVYNRELNLVADRSITWMELITLRATTHLPAHTDKFNAWARLLRSQ